MDKKLIVLSSVLVLALFLISSCVKEPVGRLPRERDVEPTASCKGTPLYSDCGYRAYNYSNICGAIKGCSWTDLSMYGGEGFGICSGTVVSCNQQSEKGCKFIPGCVWK